MWKNQVCYLLFARLWFVKFLPNNSPGKNFSRLLNKSFSPKESLWSLQDGGYLFFLISNSHRSSELETSWKGRVEEDKPQPYWPSCLTDPQVHNRACNRERQLLWAVSQSSSNWCPQLAQGLIMSSMTCKVCNQHWKYIVCANKLVVSFALYCSGLVQCRKQAAAHKCITRVNMSL